MTISRSVFDLKGFLCFRRIPVSSRSSWQRGSTHSHSVWSPTAGEDAVEVWRWRVSTRWQGSYSITRRCPRRTHSPHSGPVVLSLSRPITGGTLGERSRDFRDLSVKCETL